MLYTKRQRVCKIYMLFSHKVNGLNCLFRKRWKYANIILSQARLYGACINPAVLHETAGFLCMEQRLATYMQCTAGENECVYTESA